MTQSTTVKLFQDKNIRALWDEEREKWYFSVVDVVGVLSESDNPNAFLRDPSHLNMGLYT